MLLQIPTTKKEEGKEEEEEEEEKEETEEQETEEEKEDQEVIKTGIHSAMTMTVLIGKSRQ
jgi:hypothetical protein